VARAEPVAPVEVQAAGDLALWYDQPAGSTWLRALPVGNGRLGAMVFGNTDTERLQLNEDTLWAGGPHDYSNTRGAGSLAEIRRLVFASQWMQAQDLVNQTMLGNPAGELAYQPAGDLRLTLPGAGGVSGYQRWLDLTTATTVVTLDLAPTDVALPLGQFQAQPLDAQGVRRIVSAINNARSKPLAADHLELVFSTFWPHIEPKVSEILNQAEGALVAAGPGRSDRELLEEVLESIRSANRAGHVSSNFAPPPVGFGGHALNDAVGALIMMNGDVGSWGFNRFNDQAELMVDVALEPATLRKLEAVATLYDVNLIIRPLTIEPSSALGSVET
jgi:hypothetical protein